MTNHLHQAHPIADAACAELDGMEVVQYGNAVGVCWEGTSHNAVKKLIAIQGLSAADVRGAIIKAKEQGWPRRNPVTGPWPS